MKPIITYWGIGPEGSHRVDLYYKIVLLNGIGISVADIVGDNFEYRYLFKHDIPTGVHIKTVLIL